MVINRLDDIEFRLNKEVDFSWLKRYGRAFTVIDETGSGCICIGMEKNNRKYFCKIAGVDTIEAELEPKKAIETLKKAVELYRILEHHTYNWELNEQSYKVAVKAVSPCKGNRYKSVREFYTMWSTACYK